MDYIYKDVLDALDTDDADSIADYVNKIESGSGETFYDWLGNVIEVWDDKDYDCRMRENLDCLDFIYIPVDCVDDMDYVIAAINYVIKSFGYKTSWDCLNYVEVGGKYCIHLYLEEL